MEICFLGLKAAGEQLRRRKIMVEALSKALAMHA